MKYTQKCVVYSPHFTLSLPSTVTLTACIHYFSTNTFTNAGPKFPLPTPFMRPLRYVQRARTILP